MTIDKDEVWKKGKTDSNNDAKVFRKDVCDAWIRYNKYGDRDSVYGWEVDHMDPDKGDHIDNLRPLHWENNVAKSDAKGGSWNCAVKSNGNKNVKV